jgi:hypothetical protein
MRIWDTIQYHRFYYITTPTLIPTQMYVYPTDLSNYYVQSMTFMNSTLASGISAICNEQDWPVWSGLGRAQAEALNEPSLKLGCILTQSRPVPYYIFSEATEMTRRS